ncbi:MAG: ABC transporter substrate-binding protein [Bacteroidetes bacterium]|nr:ABC transporter substrate-binding protein [Bacteroidota bacterium]
MQYTDQMGQVISLSAPPQRIISLVPSQTEFLLDIGLQHRLAGITRYCIHPEVLVTSIPRIGGTKQLQLEKIIALQPDLIIGNKEENTEADIRALQQHFPVWMSDIYNLEDSYRMMEQLGEITGTSEPARELVRSIQQSFDDLPPIPPKMRPSVAYFIWRKPYMVTASGTFIHHLLGVLGLRNVFEHETRYPQIQPEQLQQMKPDFIFLSSEPYAFGEKHRQEFKDLVPDAQVLVVDGECFSWYGSRLQHTAYYFAQLRSRYHIT